MQQSQHAVLLNQYDEVVGELEIDEHGYWHFPKDISRMPVLLGDEFRVVGYSDSAPAPEPASEVALA